VYVQSSQVEMIREHIHA